MPARTGEIQCVSGRADQANQKRLERVVSDLRSFLQVLCESACRLGNRSFLEDGSQSTYPIGTPKQPIWAHKSLYSGGMLVRPSLRARWWCLA
jgi:hypothetical protein